MAMRLVGVASSIFIVFIYFFLLRIGLALGTGHLAARSPFASVLQMDDLKDVLPQVGFDYTTAGGGNYQDNCPACRRRLVTLAQSRRVGGFG